GQIRCFTNIIDVADAIAQFSLCPEVENQAVNIGNPEPVTVKELAEKIVDLGRKLGLLDSNYELRFEHQPVYADDVKKRVPDVSHDAEDDKSSPIVQEMQAEYPGLRLLHNQLGRGVVNAIRAGVAAARSDIVTILVADDTGPVLVVDDMLALMRENCDFVSCTRYAHGGRRLGGSLIGEILSRTANWLFFHVARSTFTDATTVC